MKPHPNTKRQKPPNIDHLLKARLREALAKHWDGTEEELDAETTRLWDFATELGRRLHAKHDETRAHPATMIGRGQRG